jgi:hypothetical protein
MMMADVIPCRYPGSDTDPGKIQAQIVAGHVARLGDAHEATFPPQQYPFLQDKSSQTYLYYQWLVTCYREKIDINRFGEIDEYFAQNYIRRAPLGYLNLSNSDKEYLLLLLNQNNASKESIRQLRKWCLDRAHSIATIAFHIYTHMVTIMQTPQNPTCFDQIKNTLYVLNDMFFNWKSAVWKGPYTSGLTVEEENRPIDIVSPFVTYLPTILFYSLAMAQFPDQKSKIVRLVEIWQTKDFLDAGRYSLLHAAMTQPEPPAPPEYPTLYPVALSSNELAQFRRIEEPIVSLPFLPPPPPPIPYSQFSESQSEGVHQSLHQPPPPPPPPAFFQPHHSMASVVPQPQPPVPVAIDPLLIPVGALANLVKGYLRCGGEPFTTIDPLQSPINVLSHVEPGRLNVRLLDFYRKLETSLPPPPQPPRVGFS